MVSGYVRYNHYSKLFEGYTGTPHVIFATFYKSKIISKLKKYIFKNIQKKVKDPGELFEI